MSKSKRGSASVKQENRWTNIARNGRVAVYKQGKQHEFTSLR